MTMAYTPAISYYMLITIGFLIILLLAWWLLTAMLEWAQNRLQQQAEGLHYTEYFPTIRPSRPIRKVLEEELIEGPPEMVDVNHPNTWRKPPPTYSHI